MAKISVKYFKTRAGHEADIGHLSLTPAEHESIAVKIADKISFSAILDKVRDSVKNSELERIHLITRKDLYNIENSYNLNSASVRHREDAVSGVSWAKEMENTGNVLLYKA
ncbi:hypothetical protein QE152_g25542 [Popillia japonica]|uniref:Uncharacterized protein n=1 Tax=Popillia japonica TaxID=7064 RepID=A0AAW1K1B7_POPJA